MEHQLLSAMRARDHFVRVFDDQLTVTIAATDFQGHPRTLRQNPIANVSLKFS
jgi:hypothetical protein